MLGRTAGHRTRLAGLILVLAGAAMSVTAAVSLWFPTYYTCTTASCSFYHYVDWTAVAFWIIGAALPVIAAVRVRFLGFYAFVALIVLMVTVIGDLFQNGFVSVGGFTPVSQQSLIDLLLVLLAGYGAEMAGVALLSHGTSKVLEAPPPRSAAS